jgi:hypothetical protein
MKVCLKYVFLVVIAVSLTDIQAQIKSGYVFGVNISTVSLKTAGITSPPDRQGGIHMGGFFEIPLTRRFIFEPNLWLSAKGSTYKIDSIMYSLSPIYMEVPLNIMVRFGKTEPKISFYAGPYFAFGIGGLKMDLKGNLRDISYGSGEKHDLKPFDFGLNFGAGLHFKLLKITAQYGMGLANISTLARADTEMKNNVFGISLCFSSRQF